MNGKKILPHKAAVTNIFGVLLFVPSIALAQYLPVMEAVWSEVTKQEDGTLIEPSELSYKIYNSDTEAVLWRHQGFKMYV